jgi:hypothetical protein
MVEEHCNKGAGELTAKEVLRRWRKPQTSTSESNKLARMEKLKTKRNSTSKATETEIRMCPSLVHYFSFTKTQANRQQNMRLVPGGMLLAAAVFFFFFLSAALPLVGHTVPAAPSPGEELAWVKEAAGGSLRGRNALVTGASRGIGREVAHLLARVAGAHTILACRDISACQKTAQEIRQLAPAASVECAELDLARLSSVERFAEAFAGGSASSARPLHLLVHNAGVMAVDDHRTEDGFESTFQVNHLAPFYLTNLLLPSLRAASSASSPPLPPLRA